jgi:hypothetical protein
MEGCSVKTRVIVCGSRNFTDKEICFKALDQLLGENPNVEIISGHAKGADQFGEEYAALHGIPTKVFLPDWKRYGRGAGPIRNREMLSCAKEESPLVVAFWDGKSKGTKNMIEIAQAEGMETHVVLVE